MLEKLNPFHTQNTLRKIVQTSQETHSWTPDQIILDQSEKVLVFEYGDLRNGFPHHRMLGGTFSSYGITHDYFYLWHDKEKGYPLASKIGGINAGRTRVRGELYLVPSNHVMNIDRHRENGVRFHRKTVWIILPDGNRIQAYSYVAVDAYWKETIQWDNTFHKGNGGSTYVPMNADTENKHDPTMGRWTEFTPETINKKKPCHDPYARYRDPPQKVERELPCEFLSYNHDTGEYE